MLTRRSLGKQAAASVTAALGMVGAAEAGMATSGQVSGASGGFTGSLPPMLVEAVLKPGPRFVPSQEHWKIGDIIQVFVDDKEPMAMVLTEYDVHGASLRQAA